MKIDGSQSLRIVAMVLAGGRVGELSVLTMQRPKAALPFAGYFRIIDFALSNLMRAGINRVGILSQYRPASLIEHVGTGESWDFVGLDRSAKILPPFWGGDAGDWYQGNADAVDQNWNFLADVEADLVLVLSGDHIYRTDYRDLIQAHLDSGADFTVAVKKMAYDPHYGYAQLDSDHRVLAYIEKPEAPRDEHASLTIYLANTRALRDVFDSEPGRRGELLEFGKDVIPYMLGRYDVRGHVFSDYWAYTRTIPMYYEAHQDLLRGRIDLDAWGVRTNLQDTLVASQPPARFGAHAEVSDSFISTGCEIDGQVLRSVLSPGVRVERGARVVDSILCHNTVVGTGSAVFRTISDKHVTIGPETRCGSESSNGDAAISLIGKQGRIGHGCRLQAGVMVLPGGKVADGDSLGDST